MVPVEVEAPGEVGVASAASTWGSDSDGFGGSWLLGGEELRQEKRCLAGPGGGSAGRDWVPRRTGAQGWEKGTLGLSRPNTWQQETPGVVHAGPFPVFKLASVLLLSVLCEL